MSNYEMGIKVSASFEQDLLGSVIKISHYVITENQEEYVRTESPFLLGFVYEVTDESISCLIKNDERHKFYKQGYLAQQILCPVNAKSKRPHLYKITVVKESVL